MFPEASTGTDPPNGASINYWLKENQQNVKIIITDSKRDTIKTINKKGSKGINRLWWDFKGESTDEIILRTKPQFAEWVSLGDERKRKLPFSISIMSPPGVYNINLILGDEVVTKSLEVMKDPHSDGEMEDIMLQDNLMRKIYDDVNITAHYINSIEIIRRQLLDLKSMILNTSKDESLILTVEKLEEQFLNVEKKLVQLKETGTGQDDVRFEKMIGEKLAYLAGNIPNADFRPADSYYEVYDLLHKRLEEVGLEYNNLRNKDLKNVIEELNENGINTIVLK
tara:strand:+ start:34 stop:879 length:846 start_codon:yes stop_codon:yes gene_type:complete